MSNPSRLNRNDDEQLLTKSAAWYAFQWWKNNKLVGQLLTALALIAPTALPFLLIPPEEAESQRAQRLALQIVSSILLLAAVFASSLLLALQRQRNALRTSLLSSKQKLAAFALASTRDTGEPTLAATQSRLEGISALLDHLGSTLGPQQLFEAGSRMQGMLKALNAWLGQLSPTSLTRVLAETGTSLPHRNEPNWEPLQAFVREQVMQLDDLAGIVTGDDIVKQFSGEWRELSALEGGLDSALEKAANKELRMWGAD